MIMFNNYMIVMFICVVCELQKQFLQRRHSLMHVHFNILG